MSDIYKDLKLLTVEDDAVNRILLKKMLLFSGLSIGEIHEAGSLQEAFTLIEQNVIDVILLDLNLPDSEGLATLDSLQDKYCNIPIVVITGEHDEGGGLKAISQGAQDYLLKGKFNVDGLSKTIRYGIERKESEEKARKNERIFQTLISHMPQRVLMKDKNFEFVCCNEKYSQTLGLSPSHIVGKSDYDLYPKEMADLYRASDERVIQTGETLEEFSRYTKGEKEIITRILKTPVKNESGSVEGVICVFEDFTERIKAEGDLRLANKELEDSNRQLKEMQAQLVQSEKLASIGHLAAGIAHEINNPMGFVNSNFKVLHKYISSLIKFLEMNIQSLEEACVDCPSAIEKNEKILQAKKDLKIDFIFEDIEELFSDSTEGINRIIKIVQNLRDFSRVDQVGDFEYYDLNHGIESTMIVAKNEIKYYADVNVELGEIPEVYCNSGQMNQVLLNILVNAAQAIQLQKKKEKGLICIRTYAKDDKVIAEIEDNGPGIPNENLTKIFDPFFTTKPVGKGTGLGLNLSYDIIVNKHHGSLDVESEVGKGTTFKIILPVNREDQKDNEESENGKENCIVC